jgi:hypothetical protein
VARALREAFGVTEAEDIRMLTTGLSSALVFRIAVRGRPYLLRVITRTDAMNDPTRQFACMKSAAEAGLAPRVWYTSIEDRISIKEAISLAVLNSSGKLVMECIIETKASSILQFFAGLRGSLQVTFEEGTWAAWLYDLLKPHVTNLVVCNPRRKALLKEGSKSDRIDARKLAELLRSNLLRPVYHGEHGLRTLKKLARSYLTISKDLGQVMSRLKAIYHSCGIPCTGKQVYASGYRAEWLGKIAETALYQMVLHRPVEPAELTRQVTASFRKRNRNTLEYLRVSDHSSRIATNCAYSTSETPI